MLPAGPADGPRPHGGGGGPHGAGAPGPSAGGPGPLGGGGGGGGGPHGAGAPGPFYGKVACMAVLYEMDKFFNRRFFKTSFGQQILKARWMIHM